jgi:hypothetical protein
LAELKNNPFIPLNSAPKKPNGQNGWYMRMKEDPQSILNLILCKHKAGFGIQSRFECTQNAFA